jgi:uncharacterized protein
MPGPEKLHDRKSKIADDEVRKTMSEAMKRVEDLLSLLPGDAVKDARAKLERLRGLMVDQRPPSLVLVGRRGAGKSSLINALMGQRVAEVGHVKAETATASWYRFSSDKGALDILDTRGLQEGSTPEGAAAGARALDELLLEVRKQKPDAVLFVAKATEVDAAIDADIQATERVLLEVERIHKSKVTLLGVATHCDTVEPKNVKLHKKESEESADWDEKSVRIAEIERHLDRKLRERMPTQVDGVVGVSSYMSFRASPTTGEAGEPHTYALRADERWQMDVLADKVFRLLPDASKASFARLSQVRALQDELASDLTRITAGICAAVAAIPIPIADAIPLTSMQLALIGSIAWLGGRDLSTKAAAEFLTAMGVNVGVAFALREGARAIAKWVFPGGGSAISAVVAFSGTMAIGRAARAYFLSDATLEEAKAAFENKEEDEDPKP